MATAESETAAETFEEFDPGLPETPPPEKEFLENLDISEPGKSPPDAADDKIPAATDAAPAKPAEEGQPAEGEGQPAFDPELVARAVAYGFTADDFETPGQLSKLVTRMDRNVAAYGRQTQRPAEEPAAKPADEKPAIDFATLEKLYEPELIGPLKLLHEQNQRLASQVEQFHAHVQQQQAATQQRQAEAFEQRFNSLIDGAHETYGEVLGKGQTRKLDPQSAEYGNRVQIIEEMVALQAGYQQMGRAVPPPDELFNRAVRSVFADQIEKNTRHKITERLRDSKGQFVQPPSHKRASDKPHGTERAVEAVARYMQDGGIQP